MAEEVEQGPMAPFEGELIYMQADHRVAAGDPLCPAADVVRTWAACEAGQQAIDRVTPEHLADTEDFTPRGTSLWAQTPGQIEAVERAALGAAAQAVVMAADLDLAELEADF